VDLPLPTRSATPPLLKAVRDGICGASELMDRGFELSNVCPQSKRPAAAGNGIVRINSGTGLVQLSSLLLFGRLMLLQTAISANGCSALSGLIFFPSTSV
jgi:hypothetical protein